MAQILFFHGTIENNRAFLADLKKFENIGFFQFVKMCNVGATAFGTNENDTISVGSYDTWISNGRSFQISFEDIAYFYSAYHMTSTPDFYFDDDTFNKKGDRLRTYTTLTDDAMYKGYMLFLESVKHEIKVLNSHFRRLNKLGV